MNSDVFYLTYHLKIWSHILWKEWCWSWNSSTLATSCDELTHWKRLWCWEGLGAGGEGDDRGWDDWMASLTSWMLSLSELREMMMDREAGRAAIHGVTKSRTRLSDWTELNWTLVYIFFYLHVCICERQREGESLIYMSLLCLTKSGLYYLY